MNRADDAREVCADLVGSTDKISIYGDTERRWMTDLQRLDEPLPEREIEVLKCIVEGLSNHEIANRLHLAQQTVIGYNSEIYSKLGVKNRADAVECAGALGLLETNSGA